jgi:dienelactone hydrolase
LRKKKAELKVPSINLNPHEYPDLQPAFGLFHLYQPENAPYRFQASSLGEALQWQASTREALLQAIGFADLPAGDFDPQRLESIDKGDYIREKWLIRTWDFALMPFYLLVPKHVMPPYRLVLALHGHGYGVKEIVGLWEDGQERDTPDGYQADFGVALCQRGFLVAAPEISCFGERQNDYSQLNTLIGQPVPYTCHHTAGLAFHLGGSVIGLRAFDARRLLDFLSSRADIDPTRIGAMGISGGGMHTLFSACLDERIRACVISGYFSSFRASILNVHHCSCNYVPGLWRFGEMHDLIGLVAPRPVLIEAGTYDPIFPLDAVKAAVAIAREKVYNVFNASEQIETDIFEGRHRISGRRAYDFLWEKLS